MATIQATITAIGSGPWSVAQLFANSGLVGVTVTPATPSKPPRIARFLSIQNDPTTTSTTNVLTGDSKLTSGPSTGRSLAPGNADIRENIMTALTGVFVNATVNGAIVNITADGGFQ